MLDLLFLFVILLHHASTHIEYLNDSEYSRMPALFHLDHYEPCIYGNNNSGVYCLVKFHLVTDEPSELYDMIRNYSEWTVAHFNHTQLSYGVCLTKTCSKYYDENTTSEPGQVLEACLNESLWENYKLKTRVYNKYSCHKAEEKIEIDTSDISVAAVFGVLLMLNLIGSLHDFYIVKDPAKGNPFLACFSIRKNWKKMVAPAGEGSEPRLTRLKGFYGIKALFMFQVIMCHSLLPAALVPANPHYLEESNRHFPMLTNGAVVIQTYFVMSGFLLVYNMLIHAEKNKQNWSTFFEAISNRWISQWGNFCPRSSPETGYKNPNLGKLVPTLTSLQSSGLEEGKKWVKQELTPVYMAMLAFTATWLRHCGSGPLWQSVVGEEIQDCRRDWWLHLLYLNNYVDYSRCMPHTWYLGADFQLYTLGLMVYLLTRGVWRKIILALLLIAGVIMPAVHTYYQDLDGVMLMTPEAGRHIFHGQPTFNSIYKRGHTNLASFIIGMFFGMVVYHLQNNDVAVTRIAKYRHLFPITVPAMLAIIMSGAYFFQDAPRASVYIRIVFALTTKPLYGFFVGILIVGMVFKMENVYRRIQEWPGWAVPSRVSYCSYILHIALIKHLIATRTTLVTLSMSHALECFSSSISLSFLFAVPLHLLVEAPFCALAKMKKGNKMEKEISSISLAADLNNNKGFVKSVV